jgi:predicted NBD/HSP70 family sugar kinase
MQTESKAILVKPALSKSRILTDKERKNLAILEVIRKNGPISRTDISKITEFNIVTVSNYVNHYIKKGLVLEGELDESTGGRKPVLVELNPKAGYVIGAGLNMLSMVCVLTDLESNVVAEVKKERKPENSEEVVHELAQLAADLISKVSIDKEKIVGAGVAIPGIIDERGRTIRWPGALGTKDLSVCVSVREIFEKKLGFPTFVENDANAAVLGEKWLGLDRDISHMLYMFSGVGCGLMIDGEIFRGTSGAAGELGIFNPAASSDDAAANALHLGRWEMDLGMGPRAKQLIEKGEKSVIKDLVKGDLSKITIKTLIQAARDKDPVATRVIQEGGVALGKKVAFLVNLLNPEVVVIGGGIEDCGSMLLDAIKGAVKEWAVEEAANVVKIIPSAFGENSIALGVVGIVVREIFAQA